MKGTNPTGSKPEPRIHSPVKKTQLAPICDFGMCDAKWQNHPKNILVGGFFVLFFF